MIQEIINRIDKHLEQQCLNCTMRYSTVSGGYVDEWGDGPLFHCALLGLRYVLIKVS